MLPVIIIFGLKFGVFTPTEAAVVAAVYSLFVAVFIYRELKLLGALRASSSPPPRPRRRHVPGRRGARLGLADHRRGVCRARWSTCSSRSWATRSLLMIAIMVLVVIVGTAMDMTPTILILTPVLMPVVKAAGIDPVYFGVLFIINNSIGLITPPVGTVLNVVAGVSRISMEDLIKGVWPFLIARADRAAADGPVPAARHGAGALVLP